MKPLVEDGHSATRKVAKPLRGREATSHLLDSVKGGPMVRKYQKARRAKCCKIGTVGGAGVASHSTGDFNS